MELSLIPYDHPILYSKLDDFDFSSTEHNIEELSTAVVKAMYDFGGFGLAFPQVGLPIRAFAMRGAEYDLVCFNPRIVEHSVETIMLEESCLSFPGVVIKKDRPRHIRVRFQGPNGETFTETYTGLTARIFQHEVDHLDGITIFDSVSKLKRDMALKKASKMGYKYDVTRMHGAAA